VIAGSRLPGLSSLGYVLPFSRKHEYAATRSVSSHGQGWVRPNAALSFWRKFSQGKSSGAIDEFLSTHPVGQNRIEKLEALLPKATVEYEMAPRSAVWGDAVVPPGRRLVADAPPHSARFGAIAGRGKSSRGEGEAGDHLLEDGFVLREPRFRSAAG